MITIIMYHYVRDLNRSRYPRIKGLSTRNFAKQLDFITKHYTVCSLAQVIAAFKDGNELPDNACVLTFDDGFVDHYINVFPMLEERGLVGSFFPPAKVIQEPIVLDVHKIHFLLACVTNHKFLAWEILKMLREFRGDYEIPDDNRLMELYARPGRYDPPEVLFIKNILQQTLPPNVRNLIVDRLFKRYVTEDEQAFAAELYMDIKQLRCMFRHGMEIGGHGYSHDRLGLMSGGQQENEILRSLEMMENIHGSKPVDWVMCYPYGSYNKDTIALLKKHGCSIALTTNVGAADLSRPMELCRFDTNDITY